MWWLKGMNQSGVLRSRVRIRHLPPASGWPSSRARGQYFSIGCSLEDKTRQGLKVRQKKLKIINLSVCNIVFTGSTCWLISSHLCIYTLPCCCTSVSYHILYVRVSILIGICLFIFMCVYSVCVSWPSTLNAHRYVFKKKNYYKQIYTYYNSRIHVLAVYAMCYLTFFFLRL